jgi:hypothetical protein
VDPKDPYRNSAGLPAAESTTRGWFSLVAGPIRHLVLAQAGYRHGDPAGGTGQLFGHKAGPPLLPGSHGAGLLLLPHHHPVVAGGGAAVGAAGQGLAAHLPTRRTGPGVTVVSEIDRIEE